jgi:hypothetical protein
MKKRRYDMMWKTSIMLAVMILMLAVSVASAANEVYLDPHPVYIPECGNATVQVRMDVTDTIDTWSTMIEFDDTCVNITDVDFTGGVTPTNASWEHHVDYIYLGGTELTVTPGDCLLANLTVECDGSSCGPVDLNLIGDENIERLVAGLPDTTSPRNGTIYSATWMDGSAQCVGCGDVNCDGYITPADAGEAFNRYLNPLYTLKLPWAADVNDDSSVTPADAGEIFNRYLNPYHVLNCHCE